MLIMSARERDRAHMSDLTHFYFMSSFLDPLSVVDFNPFSTNPARLQPISYLTRLKFKVTTLKVLTRLHNLGCNPFIQPGLNF